ncbi:MAG: energy-coupling factor transporter transmembrane component T family protein [Candidatus Zipacnadales bacterium]
MSRPSFWYTALRPAFSPGFAVGLLFLLVLAVCLIDVRDAVQLISLSFIAVGALVGARTPLRTALLRLIPLLSFAGLGALLLLLAPAQEGTPTVTLPPFPKPISAQGIGFLTSLLVRSTLIVLIVTAFGSIIRERDILLGLRGLHLPSRLVDLSYLILRNIRVVRDEIVRLLRARDSRGQPHGLLAARSAASIARVLLIRLGQRAEVQAAALYARGFTGSLRVVDTAALSPGELALLLALAASLGWLTWGL